MTPALWLLLGVVLGWVLRGAAEAMHARIVRQRSAPSPVRKCRNCLKEKQAEEFANVYEDCYGPSPRPVMRDVFCIPCAIRRGIDLGVRRVLAEHDAKLVTRP